MEDNTKGAVADDLALCVGQISSLSSKSILDTLADDFCRHRFRQSKPKRPCNEGAKHTTHSQAAERSRPVLRHHSAEDRERTSNQSLLSRVRRALIEHLVGGAWFECKEKRGKREEVQVRRLYVDSGGSEESKVGVEKAVGGR